jgi:hypothetical protein
MLASKFRFSVPATALPFKFSSVGIIVWVFAPSYKFPAKKRFEGQEWYNPYLGLDSAKWYAASLHIMPKGGNIFKGSNYEVENKILSFYRSKSITYPSISDKHSIKIADATDKLNFNSYEHGFNLLGQKLDLL